MFWSKEELQCELRALFQGMPFLPCVPELRISLCPYLMELKLFHFWCSQEKLLISLLSCPSNSSGEVQYFCPVLMPVSSPMDFIHNHLSISSVPLLCSFQSPSTLALIFMQSSQHPSNSHPSFPSPCCFCFTKSFTKLLLYDIFYEGHTTLSCFSL